MERDFMGLKTRDSNVYEKEEAVEDCYELDFSKALAIQWPFSNKISVPSHFMAFKPAPEEKIANTVPSVELENFVGVTTKKLSFSGSLALRPHPIHPSLGSVAGTTKTRFNFKPSESSPQLTIFYGGMVNVFDNISPEKAQAILFFAGNVSAKVAHDRPQTQPPLYKQGRGDDFHLCPQLAYTTPNSDLSSPLSVSSHPIVQSCKDSRSKDEVMPIKPVAVLGTPISRIDTPKISFSTTVKPSAIPQARNASLARFLEKRKDRIMSSAPYNIGKNSHECATSGSRPQ